MSPRPRSVTDERTLLEHIDQVLGPCPAGPASGLSPARLELFRRRFASALFDLELTEDIGVTAEFVDGLVVITTRDWRAAERLLSVLDCCAARPPWDR